ncbi:hypothetical protein G6F56_011783 [Rhizopus delemar]|nr:hypothetical protein G6F56_011783 [Rhizopus delemar]
MLGVSLKRFKTNSVQPQPQAQPQPQPQKKLNVSSSSSNQLASYLQKKVSSMQAKKLIRQFRDFDLKLKRHPDHSVLFESDELLTKNPKTPPKKSKTMPSFTLDNLNEGNEWTQELSDLPSEVSSCSDQKVGGLTRASTWVGKSIRNFLKPMSGQQSITEGSNDSIFNQDMAEIYEYSRTPTLNESTSKMTLHCRILQITNLSSSKAYPYTLSLRVTDDEPQTYSGIMKRVARGVSTSNPHATLSL